ncbi:MAG: T9SS type A sorting domain-containing protein [Ignavibacteriaceae bacterium]
MIKITEPEFAVAFQNKNGNIEIRVFDINQSTLEPVQKAAIDDEYMDTTLNNSGLYDISSGDFDGDGRDEIVLAYYTELKENDWHISTKIYDYIENNGSFSLVPKAKKDNFFTSNDFFDSYHHINDLLVAAGDFKNNTFDEFVVDFVLYRSGSETYNKLLPASVTIDLDTINVDLNNLKDIFQTLGESYIGIGLITGDINNDGKDEIVIDGDGRIRIYDVDTTLNILGYVSNGSGSYDFSRRRMILADLDASTTDSVWNPEIITSSTSYHQPDNGENYTVMSIEVFEPVVDPSGDIISLNKRTSMVVDSTNGPRSYYWAITAGDFDGGGIRLGKPSYFSATDIVQPLVILNAPPTHFDLFNDTTYDVNDSYNGASSDFFSKYYTSSETDIEVESELHSGWSVGGKVEGGFTIPKVDIGVKVKIEGEYGQNFSKQTFNRNTYKVSQNISASNDDYIYATIVDYDIWEYPIIANDTIQGYTLVVSPGQPKKSWFPSKSPQAADYLPDHEVGNILSYRQIAVPSDNGALQTALRWNTSDEITLDGSPGFEYNWSLENENQTQTTESNEVHWEIGGSVSFDIPFKYIPNFEINGKYDQSTISTRTNRVTYKKGLDVHLGPIDLGIGETYYSVQPYAYWAKSGALVLDYAVNPRPSGINVPQTWWQERYSEKPDPALILPWRLDPEKGYNISEDKRQQTKEIIFNPDDPNPGENINIQARIHNYSLMNTSGPVEARFYLGDPLNGGTLIQSTDGKTTFSTSDYIEARGSKIISFDWKLPDNTPFYPRIYVVLDPDNKIDEIHESNNTGWKVLNYTGGTTGIENEKNIPVSFNLSQNYPNPFNPSTTIEYTIPNSRFVSLKVYDILGREVKTLVNREVNAGNHKVQFDGSGIASGVYFYRIEAGEFISTKKFVLLK